MNKTQKPVVRRTGSELKNIRNWRVVLPVVLLVLVVGAIGISNWAENGQTVCGNYRVDKAIKVGSATISAEVASTEPQREKGLSGRPCITADEAMLFIFNQPGIYPFWMKDMKFPIDIVWVDASHKVVDLKQNVSPSSYPHSFNNSVPAQYVIEFQANRSQTLGLRPGRYISF